MINQGESLLYEGSSEGSKEETELENEKWTIVRLFDNRDNPKEEAIWRQRVLKRFGVSVSIDETED